ncbi:MAG: M14 family metallopeptidase [Pirellulaceae bacterium]|nr:M14 family metallopeptidase [Pirellulaceae bacterium]
MSIRHYQRLKTSLMLAFALLLPGGLFAQQQREATSDRPASKQLTTPKKYLGYRPGDDFHLTPYEKAIGYVEQLASETDRMIIKDMGGTSFGRRMKYAVISSPENLQKLEHYREISKKLSLVRGVEEKEARQLSEEGKAIVWIDGTLHADEVAPGEVNIRLAYDMVAREDRQAREIRKNVILLLVFANPDGMSIVANWYNSNVGTQYEESPVPILYHKYAGHDNNRDWFISNLLETQNMNIATSKVWFPHILYNQHQTAPFPARIWIPPESEPTNPNIHPITLRWKNLIGSAMGKAFEEAGQDGAISRISFDSWYPGYATQIVDSHNIPSILTETAGNRYATPKYINISDFPKAHQDLTVGVFYPSPWKGGWWRIGDAVDYNLTACFSIMEVAAKYRYEFLYNKWRVGKDIIEQYADESPYGWILPAKQKDEATTRVFIERMLMQGVEIYQTQAPFTHNGIEYAKGTYLLPTSQPFGLFVKNVMEIQEYPDLKKYPHLWQNAVSPMKNSEEPLRAYDGVGWTLPIQMGVDYRAMTQSLNDLGVKTKIVTKVAHPKIRFPKNPVAYYVLSATSNNSAKVVNHIQRAGGQVSIAVEGRQGKKGYDKGSYIVGATTISAEKMEAIAQEAEIHVRGFSAVGKRRSISKPRLAIYQSWRASMDGGWIRLVFDNYGFSYHNLLDAEIRAGELHKRFDVIVLPDQGASTILNGHKKGTIHPDYVGGIGKEGLKNLKEFVEQGGRLICNKSSSDLAIDAFDLPVKNSLRGISGGEFSIPGSIVKMNYNQGHPLTRGMDKEGIAFFSGAKAFEIITPQEEASAVQKKDSSGENGPKGSQDQGPEKDEKKPLYRDVQPTIVASYPDKELLVSGWEIGADKLHGKGAIIETKIDKGSIVLFGFNVHNRAQTFSTFKLLFNAILDHSPKK